jgi:hypothetical protein
MRLAIWATALIGFMAGCGPSCPQGQTLCEGVCADLSGDRAHCGACGAACGSGEVCDGTGACAVSCTASLTECGGSCVDTEADEANCGGCGVTCGEGESCVDGDCEATCGAGLLACDGACVDPMTNTAYCGASGDCSGANAGSSCTADQACAGGGCVDIHPCSLPPAGGTPGLTLGTVSGPAIEGGGAVTYTLVLDAQPCDNVYVSLTPNAQLALETAMVVFTPENWDEPQLVSVSATADADREGDHNGSVTHAIASGDSAYDGLAIGAASIPIVDAALLWHASVPAVSNSEGSVRSVSVSSTGIVAFTSGAANLVSDDTNGRRDAFRFDPSTGAVTRVSVAASGAEANDSSEQAVISADGSTIAFASQASNLTATPTDPEGEIFLVEGTSPIVQITPPCSGCAQEISLTVAISEDGSVLAFSTRRAYATTDADGEFDIFVWSAGTLTLESLNSADQNGTFFWGSNAFGPTLSATGQFVGFQSAAGNLASPELTVQNFHAYVKDRTARTLTRVSSMSGGTASCEGSHQTSNNEPPLISRDGNHAAFGSECVYMLANGTDTNGVNDVLVRDIAAQTTTRVSIASDGTESNGRSGALAISDDGNLVLFWSDASNLVPADTNGARDIFLRDIAAGTTTRVSVGARYEELATGAELGAMSRDGAWLVFTTFDPLLPTDREPTPASSDAYLVRLR